jgi:hypothetical protein
MITLEHSRNHFPFSLTFVQVVHKNDRNCNTFRIRLFLRPIWGDYRTPLPKHQIPLFWPSIWLIHFLNTKTFDKKKLYIKISFRNENGKYIENYLHQNRNDPCFDTILYIIQFELALSSLIKSGLMPMLTPLACNVKI